MPQSGSRFLEGVTAEEYSRAQLTSLISVSLWVVLFAVLVTGALNVTQGWGDEAVALFVAASLSIAGMVLLRRGRTRLAAACLCSAMYLAIFLSAFYGAGVYDASITAFPLLILISAFVFGETRAGLVAATVVSAASMFALSGSQAVGLIEIPYPVSWLRPLVVSVILVAAGRLVWFLHRTRAENQSALVESFEATLRGWAHLLEARGGDVEGHSQRVTDLSEALAKRLGCSPQELSALRRGAYLHDIGKMAVPDSILLKPGPLDPHERVVIEAHPEVARRIISDIPFLGRAVVVPYSHHERWDGSGYPQGLKAEEIPRMARIFTVADQWDALISDRPYRSSMPVDEVARYMHDNAGTIYDPDVVDALFELLAEEPGVWSGR